VRGGGGNMCDATGNNTHSCWIAEVLYGIDAPRTLLIRGWLSALDDQGCRWRFLISLYRIYGRRVAGLIQRGHLPARLFVPLFDHLVVKATDDTTRALRHQIGGRKLLHESN
jgi:hypothetical protein